MGLRDPTLGIDNATAESLRVTSPKLEAYILDVCQIPGAVAVTAKGIEG